jgi:hypothetical protein
VEVAATGEGVEAAIGVETVVGVEDACRRGSRRRGGRPPSWRKVEAAAVVEAACHRGRRWRPPAVAEAACRHGGRPLSQRPPAVMEAGEGGSDERGVECGGRFEWRGWSAAGI